MWSVELFWNRFLFLAFVQEFYSKATSIIKRQNASVNKKSVVFFTSNECGNVQENCTKNTQKWTFKNCLKRTSNKNTGLWNVQDFLSFWTTWAKCRTKRFVIEMSNNLGHVVKMTIFFVRLFISVRAVCVVKNTTKNEHIYYWLLCLCLL